MLALGMPRAHHEAEFFFKEVSAVLCRIREPVIHSQLHLHVSVPVTLCRQFLELHPVTLRIVFLRSWHIRMYLKPFIESLVPCLIYFVRRVRDPSRYYLCTSSGPRARLSRI
jgi:hypothetical protein